MRIQENGKKKQFKIKKYKYQSNQNNHAFLNIVIQQQKNSIVQQNLVEFGELIDTLQFDFQVVKQNVENLVESRNKNGEKNKHYGLNLGNYFEYVKSNIQKLALFDLNFRQNMERVIYINKLLIGII